MQSVRNKPLETQHRLPEFIEPMLAQPGEAFDSDQHLFEIKWDGTRAMAFIEEGTVRLMNRRGRNIAARYPELQVLTALPPGTVLDGEIVVLRDGKPDFPSLQKREHITSDLKAQLLSRSCTATYVVFDQLYDSFCSTMDRPCTERRERARELVSKLNCPCVVISDGIIGKGLEYFDQACSRDLEGIVAKRLDTRYLPGKRTDAWIKIKRQQDVPCVVIGYLPNETGGLRSLIIAAQFDGALTYVGRVGSGIDLAMADRLMALMQARVRAEPVVECPLKGRWVEPEIYCTVRCMERTRGGQLRAPVLRELYEPGK
jgi:DNA ligase D-like protein (predicted ligase)